MQSNVELMKLIQINEKIQNFETFEHQRITVMDYIMNGKGCTST